MSDGLWRDDLRCGCQKGGGHSCRPSWVTEKEWSAATACDRTATDCLVNSEGFRRGVGIASTGAPDLHGITALSEQDSST